jgi:protein KRI1
MYLKDYHRRNLLAGSDNEEHPTLQVTTYEQEQNALKDAFHTTIPSNEGDEDEDLIKPKKKSKSDKSLEEQEYQAFLQQSLQDETSKKMLQQLQSLASQPPPPTLDATATQQEDGEAFLANYLLNRGWLNPSTSTPELYEDLSSDEEKAEQFETSYNFRFEQPGSSELVTHARTISTTRRGEEKRKQERERKRLQKEEAKRKEIEEIARLRNLKRMEIEERIKRVEGVSGAGGWTEKDLEGDFDPEEWDKKMKGVFDESYYDEVCTYSFVCLSVNE